VSRLTRRIGTSPVGLRVLRPEQPNRAFDVLKRKLYCEGGRQRVGEGYEGVGLKRLPNELLEKIAAPESESPGEPTEA